MLNINILLSWHIYILTQQKICKNVVVIFTRQSVDAQRQKVHSLVLSASCLVSNKIHLIFVKLQRTVKLAGTQQAHQAVISIVVS